MSGDHPLDRPAWSALKTRQAHLALLDSPSRRFDPAYAHFAAAAEGAGAVGEAALVRLARDTGPIGLFEVAATPPSALAPIDGFPCLQMICEALTPGGRELDLEPLTDTDGPQMQALAALTKPGPFLEKTHLLGPFVGVRRAGRIVATAGVRLDLDGFTEVSGVCTHPDHRGQGHAGALMRHVAARILARGDIAFLHARSAHTDTIAFYETLGFRPRAEVEYRLLG